MLWPTKMSVRTHRGEPAMTQPATSNQATDLMDHLTKQRKHVLGILENLPEEAMRRPVLPTGWTCAGLVQHLALDDERFWFRQVMTGEQVLLHVTAETACHAGHLDAARELIDGQTWLILT